MSDWDEQESSAWDEQKPYCDNQDGFEDRGS